MKMMKVDMTKLKHGDIVTVPFASGTQAAVVLYTDGDSIRVLRYAASRHWFNKTTDRFSRAYIRPGHKLAGEVRRAFRDHDWMGRMDCDEESEGTNIERGAQMLQDLLVADRECPLCGGDLTLRGKPDHETVSCVSPACDWAREWAPLTEYGGKLKKGRKDWMKGCDRCDSKETGQ